MPSLRKAETHSGRDCGQGGAAADRHHGDHAPQCRGKSNRAGELRRVAGAQSLEFVYTRAAPSPDYRFCRDETLLVMHERPEPGALDKLKTRIQALRAKTIDNGCTEDEALSAAAKVAELLDRYDLSLTDVEMRAAPCERREFETYRKKRIPLDDCIGAVAHFCDCRVWREKNPAGETRYVFFGLRQDIEVAHYLTELIDSAVRAEAGRYKTTPGYLRFRHQDRHLANASFALGMVASIADKLTAMKAARDQVNAGSGRALVVLKAAIVEEELAKLDLKLRTRRRASRMVSMTAYEAGGVAGASLAINPGIGDPARRQAARDY
jgi:hypothetical protein